MDEIKGYIDTITFVSDETGFTVAKLQEEKKQEPTPIVGVLPSIQPGETIACQGEWKNHPSYGKQFSVSSYQTQYPATVLGIQKYLESGLIKGIGPVYAKKIVDKFGTNTLEVIDNTPQRLKEVPGIGKKRIEIIASCWLEQKSIRHVMIFLQSHQVSPAYAQKIYKRYGEQSIQKVKENPYQLAQDIFGIGFKIADNIARNLGFEKTSNKRIASGIEYVLIELTNSGHSCFLEEEFYPLAEKILEVDTSLILEVLKELVLTNQVIRTSFLIGEEEKSFLWLKSYHYFETQIAKEIIRIKTSPCSIREVDKKKALDWVENQMHIKLAEEQKEAVLASLEEKIHIITGGPGTGKSTITKAILEITSWLTQKITLAAPTGRAAKRLSQITRKKASTIHSLLEFDFSQKGFKKNKENPLECDLLIIDEASMIDSMLMVFLLQAVPSHTRILIIGDSDQLPSVGAGYVLNDLIKSQTLPVTRLKRIFRQAQGSKIIYNAHRINEGIFPDLSSPDDDFQFYEIKDHQEIQNKLIDLVSNVIPKEKRFHPIDDIQILTPMRKGGLGIDILNPLMQETLNPSNKPFFKGGRKFHINDKVMQVKNNYSKNVFNGDIGKIFHIDLSEQLMTISFNNRLVEYDFSELDEIQSAYVCSVHKYQGCECPCVIMIIHTSHFKLLYKNLLYTAITRGKKQVILIGTKQAIAIAVKNQEAQKRYTGLCHFLQKNETMSCEDSSAHVE